MKFSELQRKLEKAGWYIKRSKKHHIYIHPDYNYPIMVGEHPAKEVPKGTLDDTLKKAGLK
jgi:predicted RNA binding protein YcfA (HicA-like mRNA interferase family)